MKDLNRRHQALCMCVVNEECEVKNNFLTLPQPLQWCFLLKKSNLKAHNIHIDTLSSLTHVGAVWPIVIPGSSSIIRCCMYDPKKNIIPQLIAFKDFQANCSPCHKHIWHVMVRVRWVLKFGLSLRPFETLLQITRLKQGWIHTMVQYRSSHSYVFKYYE